MHQLAIVIPAWKPDFFRSALQSLDAQTDRRFTVYVADDGGPPELAAISADFPDLELEHHRFDHNLGGTSLTGHWNRAIERSSEPWVWLFGDDDELHPECVARLHETLDALDPEVSVVRFDTDVIDAEGRVRAHNPAHPPTESRADFLHDRLLGRRNSYVVEYVFRRSAWEEAGGFPDYPAAWCADDVAWFTFAGDGPIVTIPGARVRWRASSVNITGANRSLQTEKLAAGRRYLDFITSHVAPEDPTRDDETWASARSRWFEDQVRYLSPLPPELVREVTRPGSPWARPHLQRVVLTHAWGLKKRAQAGVRRLTGH